MASPLTRLPSDIAQAAGRYWDDPQPLLQRLPDDAAGDTIRRLVNELEIEPFHLQSLIQEATPSDWAALNALPNSRLKWLDKSAEIRRERSGKTVVQMADRLKRIQEPSVFGAMIPRGGLEDFRRRGAPLPGEQTYKAVAENDPRGPFELWSGSPVEIIQTRYPEQLRDEALRVAQAAPPMPEWRGGAPVLHQSLEKSRRVPYYVYDEQSLGSGMQSIRGMHAALDGQPGSSIVEVAADAPPWEVDDILAHESGHAISPHADGEPIGGVGEWVTSKYRDKGIDAFGIPFHVAEYLSGAGETIQHMGELRRAWARKTGQLIDSPKAAGDAMDWYVSKDADPYALGSQEWRAFYGDAYKSSPESKGRIDQLLQYLLSVSVPAAMASSESSGDR